MEKLVNFLVENWDTLASAPLVFIVGVILVGGIVYGVTKWGYGREIKIKDERLKAANDEIARLKEKIAEEKKESLPQQELNGEEESPSIQLEISPEETDTVKFRTAYDEMPELIEEMKEDVDREPLVREFVLVKASLNIRDPYNPSFVYDPYQHESLQGKIHILENHGFAIEVLRKSGLPKKYRMTEEFVKLLRSSIPNHPTEIADQDSPTSHQNEEWYQYLVSDEVLALGLMTADLIHARLDQGATPVVVLKEALKVSGHKRDEAQKLIASAQRDLDLMKDNLVDYKQESALRRKKKAEENRERFDKAWIRIREYFEDENYKNQS